MVGRRALVVGSQCESMLPPPLSFLPDVAVDLAEVLHDPDLGAWQSVQLMIDPSRGDLIDAFKAEFEAAAEAEAVLLVALIGHGMARGDDFYFLPRDAPATGMSDEDVYLPQVIKELLHRHADIKGFIMLVDTCESGHVADAAASWAKTTMRQHRSNHEVMTASAADSAYQGSFTKAVIEALRTGDPESGYVMHAHAVFEAILQDKPAAAQQPQRESRGGTKDLWLAKNVALRDRAPAARPNYVFGATSHRSMRAYALSTVVAEDDSVRALAFTERDRVQLDVLWGLDRARFVGIVADPLGCDLVDDLNRVETVVADAATRAGVDLPTRRWVQLPAVRGDGSAGGFTTVRDIWGVPDDVSRVGFVLPVIVNERGWNLTESDWRHKLTGTLRSLREKHADAATVLQVQATSTVDGVRAARRITPVVRELLNHDAHVPFDVVSRLLPGQDEADPGEPQPGTRAVPDPEQMLVLLIEEITVAQARRGLVPVLQREPVDIPLNPVPPAEIAAGTVTRLATGDRPSTIEDVELPISGLLELVRAFASPLWFPVLRACARGLSGPDQTEVLLVAARLDGDLDTWLSTRAESPGLAPKDLPVAGHDVPDALVRAHHRLARPVPDWLTVRTSRSARTTYSPDRTNGVSPKDRDYWARLRTCDAHSVIDELIVLPDTLRRVVGLVADPEANLEHQVRLYVDDLRRLLRPSVERSPVS